MKQLIESIENNIGALKTTGYIALCILLVWSVLGVDLHHAHTWAEQHVPWFWSLFTLLSAVVLIFFAGWVSKNIQTSEDYYDK